VLRLPPVTAAGLDAAGAALRVRHELAVAVGLILQRANGFPPASRWRRVLAGLGKWLAGTPGHLLAEERWFPFVMNTLSVACGTLAALTVAALSLCVLSAVLPPAIRDVFIIRVTLAR
jgi:hypothetical protein